MKPAIQLSMLWICLFYASIDHALAQQIGLEKSEIGKTDRKWSISFSLNASDKGTRNGMMDAMDKEGFGDRDYSVYNLFGWVYTIDTDYPRGGAKGLAWDMEVRRKLTPHTSIAMTYGKSRTLVTNGHNFYANDQHHFLSLQTRHSVITCDYIFTMKNSYTGIKIGPALAIHQAADVYSGNDPNKVTTLKPGVHIGFDAALFEKKSWFMAFSMDYTWFTPVTVGPYAEEVTKSEDGAMKTYTSVFNPVKVPLSFLKFGLTTGWKF
jgi:hypothetical protein